MKKVETATFSRDITPAFQFGLPYIFAPLMIISWVFGGWTILLVPIFGYVVITLFDVFIGKKLIKPSESIGVTEDQYKYVLYGWVPVQFFLIFGSLVAIFMFDHLTGTEAFFLIIVQGIISGAVGIVFAHELMHQKTRAERFLSDLLMGMALYGHFRTEHVLVHHRHVGTGKDAVTARYGENFYRFFIRVIPQCFVSSWNTEKELLEKKNLPFWDFQNPFYIYASLMIFFLLLAIIIGGTLGAIFFLLQALVAVLHLEVVNYIEHYGLVRQKLDNGKFEPTRPHHSWNANDHASNLLLINLQKHSDHHARPNKKYQHLQSYDADDAPQLPFGYPLMVLMSLIPKFWMSVMNPKVLEWRKRFYPELKEWPENI